MEYKVITMREFRARLSHYIQLMGEGYNFEVNGILFGEKSKNEAKNAYTEEEPSVEAPIPAYTDTEEERTHEDPDQRREECEECGEIKSEDIYECYEDDGNHLICKNCLRRKCSSEKHFKMILKSATKIL